MEIHRMKKNWNVKAIIIVYCEKISEILLHNLVHICDILITTM